MANLEPLLKKANQLPLLPGVYLMRDAAGRSSMWARPSA